MKVVVIMRRSAPLMHIAVCALGAIYLIFASLMLYNWIITVFFPTAKLLYSICGVFIPPDPGSAVVLATTGMLLAGSVYYHYDRYKFISCVLVGSLLGSAILVLQLLTVIANAIDAQILMLYGEIVEYGLKEEIMRPDVLLGIPSAIVLYNSVRELRKQW